MPEKKEQNRFTIQFNPADLNTLETIKSLEGIGDVSCFGKHQLSYEAVLYYTKSLAGHYDELETWVNSIDKKLDAQAKSEWFYNRIKLYQADCDMLNGKFIAALSSLTLLDNGCNTCLLYTSRCV